MQKKALKDSLNENWKRIGKWRFLCIFYPILSSVRDCFSIPFWTLNRRRKAIRQKSGFTRAKEKTDFYWTNVLISISVKDSLLILIIVQHASISYCSLIPLSVNSASLSRFLGSKAPSAYSNESVRKRRRNGVREAGGKNITFLIEIISIFNNELFL